MAKGDNQFWVSSKEKAAKKMLKSINAKTNIKYVSKRWRIIAFILNNIPSSIYKRL